MQHHTNQTVLTHNLVETTKNSYIPHWKTKIFHTVMLSTTEAREIGATDVFDERQKI